tara:strand:- start:466 stop:1392 length:927 start_codon:yes stop_codon:yes gene_type:complete
MNSLSTYNKGPQLVGSALSLVKSFLSYLLVIAIFSQVLLGSFEIISERELLKYEVYGPSAVSVVSSKTLIKKVDSKTTFKSYNFSHIRPFFRGIPLAELNHISREELNNQIYKLLPRTVRDRAYSYIEVVFDYAITHNIDPLWALSIMWTESHFKTRARSHVNAQGLMQIMPRTGVYLNKLLKRPEQKKLVLELLKDPTSNIELGTFYLRRLYKRFRSYRYATVAYNMGPSFVVRRIRNGGEIGVRNDYYDKVKKRYKHLLKVFTNISKASYEEGFLSVVTYTPMKYQLAYFTGEDLDIERVKKFAKR